jgi:hypothetical protein
VETTNIIRDTLPSNHPPFQQEKSTQWIRREIQPQRGVGVMKMFSAPTNVKDLTKIFQNRFNQSQQVSCVPKEFNNSLDQEGKNQYLPSQD